MQFSKVHFHTPRPSIAHWWLATLSCMLIVALVIIMYAVILFLNAFRADEVTETVSGNVESISRETLKETINVFEKRKRAYESIVARHGSVPRASTTTPSGQ